MATTYEFPEKVFCIQALNWSKDFRLALCTESCIKILCLNQEPSNPDAKIKLRQSYVPAETDVLDIPKYDIHQHRQLHNKLARDDINSLFSDKIMNPFKYTGDLLPWTGYCASAWSPLGAEETGRSILATLSSDCRLVLHAQGTTEYHWTKITDLSSMRCKSTKPSSDYKTPDKYHDYKKWCYSQAVTAISWCPIQFIDQSDGSKYSILAAGTLSGDVVFWKIKLPCLEKTDCAVMSTNKKHSKKVLCMAWSEESGVLAVAHYHGNVTVGKVNKEFGTVKWTVLDTSEDLMKVSCLCFCNADKNNENILIVNKEQYVHGYHIQVEESGNITVISQTVVNSLREMYASGIALIDDRTFVVTSIEGNIEIVKAVLGDSGLQLEVRSMDETSVPDQHIHYNGVTVSPNKVLIAYVQRPPPGYDHLNMNWKRSTKVILRKMNHVTPECVKDILIKHTGPLSELIDVMECYRLQNVSSPYLNYEADEKKSKRELIMIRSGLYSKAAQIKTKLQKFQLGTEELDFEDKTKQLKDECWTVTVKILGLYIEQCVTCVKKRDSLVDKDFYILRNFSHFVDGHKNELAKTLDVTQLQTAFSDILKDDRGPAEVQCPACNLTMAMDRFSWKCNNGHKFEACCHTFKPCTEIDYRTCNGCRTTSLSLNELKDYTCLLGVTYCVLCESKMI